MCMLGAVILRNYEVGPIMRYISLGLGDGTERGNEFDGKKLVDSVIYI